MIDVSDIFPYTQDPNLHILSSYQYLDTINVVPADFDSYSVKEVDLEKTQTNGIPYNGFERFDNPGGGTFRYQELHPLGKNAAGLPRRCLVCQVCSHSGFG